MSPTKHLAPDSAMSSCVRRRLSLWDPISIYTLSSSYSQLVNIDNLQEKEHLKVNSDDKKQFHGIYSELNGAYTDSFVPDGFIQYRSPQEENDLTADQHHSQSKNRKFFGIFQHSKLNKRLDKVSRNRFLSTLRKNVFGKSKEKKHLKTDKDYFETHRPIEVKTEKLKEEYKRKCLSVFHNFAGETTAHGYKRWISQSRGRYLKYIWVIIGVTVLISLLCTLSYIVNNNQLNSFSTSFYSEPNERLNFPAVTVCNHFPYNVNNNDSKRISAFYYQQLKAAKVGVNQILKWSSGDDALFSNVNLTDFAFDLNKFIVKCSWKNMNLDCSDIFVRTRSAPMSCFTFNSDYRNVRNTSMVGSYGGLELVLNLGQIKPGQRTEGIKVLLHDPLDFPDTFSNIILVPPNTLTYISVEKKESSFLPSPHKAYGTEYCHDYNENEADKKSTLYNMSGYSWCLAENRLMKIIRECNCSIEGDPEIPHVPRCTVQEYFQCYLLTQSQSYKDSKQADKFCVAPCKTVHYTGTVSSVSIVGQTSQTIELNIHFGGMFTLKEEQTPKYSWPDTLGTIGGQIGLFTGASLLTLAEIVELIYVLIRLLISFVYNYIHIRCT